MNITEQADWYEYMEELNLGICIPDLGDFSEASDER